MDFGTFTVTTSLNSRSILAIIALLSHDVGIKKPACGRGYG
jgi:hypothetical protein